MWETAPRLDVGNGSKGGCGKRLRGEEMAPVGTCVRTMKRRSSGMLWMNSVTRASLAPGYCRVSSRGSGRKGLIRPLSSPIFPYLPLSSHIFPYLPQSTATGRSGHGGGPEVVAREAGGLGAHALAEQVALARAHAVAEPHARVDRARPTRRESWGEGGVRRREGRARACAPTIVAERPASGAA